MPDQTRHDLLVIGTGVAGLGAARQALTSGLSTATLEAQMFGGLILNVNQLEGEPGGSGADFASALMMEISDRGAESLSAIATGLHRDGDGLVVTSDAGRHRARAVIVASGAALKKLGVPGEVELEHKGVSHCADCDGPMLQQREVVVVGGGDSALQSAQVLAKFCRHVHLVHRGDRFRARPRWIEMVAATPSIEVHRRTEVQAVLGTDFVEGVRVREAGSDARVIPCAGFFAFIGLQPATDFLPESVARDARGGVITDATLQTSIPGVFAAGAVRSGCGGTVADAIADGEAAARAATTHLALNR